MGSSTTRSVYGCRFKALINSWRSSFSAGDTDNNTKAIPFGFVQLSSYSFETPDATRADDHWATVRAEQASIVDLLPATFMAVAIDLGAWSGGCCGDDLGMHGQPRAELGSCDTYPRRCMHPQWKQEVGRRLSLGARAIIMGETNLCHTGPKAMRAVVQKSASNASSVEVTFSACAGLSLWLRNTTDFDLQISSSSSHVWVQARVTSHTTTSIVLAPVSHSQAAGVEHSITVSGAGTTAVNGVYVATKQTALASSEWPVFEKDATHMLYASVRPGGKRQWRLAQYGNVSALYYVAKSSAADGGPPSSSGSWAAVVGESPMPSVARTATSDASLSGTETGKELVLKFNSALASNGTWHADANGREMVKRQRDKRGPSYPPYVVGEPVAANYVPVNSMIALDDGKTEMVVVTDVSMGGTSMVDGSLEVMVHRRLQKGQLLYRLGESLDETMCGTRGDECTGLTVRGSAYLVLDSIANAHATRRDLVETLNFPPTLAFANAKVNPVRPTMSGIASSLPPNVKLVTISNNYAAWNHGQLLLRFAHKYQVDEHPTLSQPASFSLAAIFSLAGMNVSAAVEMTLTGNQQRSVWEKKKLKWGDHSTEVVDRGVSSSPQERRLFLDPADKAMTVTINAMEVKTFLVTMEPLQSDTRAFKSDDSFADSVGHGKAEYAPTAAKLPTLQFSAVFGSHMVLQHAPDRARVWGSAPAGSRVTISLLAEEALLRLIANVTVTTSSTSRFLAEMPPQPPGPRAHTIRAVLLGSQPLNSTPAEVKSVLFGIVVLCGGQSNSAYAHNFFFCHPHTLP
jgi:hypothetical protein